MNLPLSAKEVPFILFYILIPISFFGSVERFVKNVNDWLIKSNSFPIGEFIFILTNHWLRNNGMLITLSIKVSIKKLKEIINVPASL